jgi:hypothetical protein
VVGLLPIQYVLVSLYTHKSCREDMMVAADYEEQP